MSTTVSHSEVDSYLLCRRRHYYGYSLGLQSVNTSPALSIGTAGHSILEVFYNEILSGEDFDAALEMARSAYAEIVAEGFQDDPKRARLQDMLFAENTGYFAQEVFVRQGYEILAVEKEFNLVYDEEGHGYPFVIDLIVRDPNGLIAVVDHKFMYDFFSDEETDLLPQIPKYVGALRGLKYPVTYGIYNQIRTRKITGEKMNKAQLVEVISSFLVAAGGFPDSDYDKPVSKMTVADLEGLAGDCGISTQAGPKPEQTYSFYPIRPNPARVKRVFIEQTAVAREVQARKALPIEEQEATAYRVGSKTVCKICDFKLLCSTELSEGNVRLVIEQYYRERDKRARIEASEENVA